MQEFLHRLFARILCGFFSNFLLIFRTDFFGVSQTTCWEAPNFTGAWEAGGRGGDSGQPDPPARAPMEEVAIPVDLNLES